MKRSLIALAFLLIFVGVSAQEHLSFKGIPIEGSMASFCKKLQSKGLKEVGSDGNTTMFTGDFTGSQATIGVLSTDDGLDVYGVTVLLPESREWRTLVDTYDYYKQLYVLKYGTPSFVKEYNPARKDANTFLMSELNLGTVVYKSEWQTPGGSIELGIEKAPSLMYQGMVVIRYRDSQNSKLKLQQDLDEI